MSIAIHPIQNSGPDNLREVLKHKFSGAKDVSIAVAFVTTTGLDEIIGSLRSVALNGRVRIITGLYQGFTDPQALRRLLDVQRHTKGRFSVSLSLEPLFHRKLYLVEHASSACIIIGSSNLTREALTSSGELNLMLKLPNRSMDYLRFRRVFDKDWENRAVPLSADQIRRYASLRPSSLPSTAFGESQIKKILGKKVSHKRKSNNKPRQRRFYRSSFAGFLRKTTTDIIRQSTNWDQKGFEWFGTGGVHPYEIGDEIFLFDFNAKALYLVTVKDVAHTVQKTPDGRHFVAYKARRMKRRRFSKLLWAKLGDLGISKSNANGSRKLQPATAEAIIQILKNR